MCIATTLAQDITSCRCFSNSFLMVLLSHDFTPQSHDSLKPTGDLISEPCSGAAAVCLSTLQLLLLLTPVQTYIRFLSVCKTWQARSYLTGFVLTFSFVWNAFVFVFFLCGTIWLTPLAISSLIESLFNKDYSDHRSSHRNCTIPFAALCFNFNFHFTYLIATYCMFYLFFTFFIWTPLEM